eukprot:TRINITY_DN4414_c0_g2_i1.p1 TRINITY_DN4414_c0_g2~~TRINITY_DN4414_c0_g2_i1.p1  ORF type:complete len:344 (-),score=45.07 TRINITY_DN4414_c0_g2_i1:209-1240(-)
MRGMRYKASSVFSGCLFLACMSLIEAVWNDSYAYTADFCCPWDFRKFLCADADEDMPMLQSIACPWGDGILGSYSVHQADMSASSCSTRKYSGNPQMFMMHLRRVLETVETTYERLGDWDVRFRLGLADNLVSTHGSLVSDLVVAYRYGSFVEVGVQRGELARAVLNATSHVYASGEMKSLLNYTGVDVWSTQENYGDPANRGNDREHATNMITTIERLTPYWNQVRGLLKYPSVVAAQTFADKGIDFIFLDARHDYCSAMEDIEAWWPKLSRGGILAGHDYHTSAICSEDRNKDRCAADYALCKDGRRKVGGVARAVYEFAHEHCLDYFTAGFADVWIIVKM